VVPVQRPQPQAGQDGRVRDPVQHPVQQCPSRPAPQLQPGDLPVHPVGDRGGVHQQCTDQAPTGPKQRRAQGVQLVIDGGLAVAAVGGRRPGARGRSAG
jgi:hypothetical protein